MKKKTISCILAITSLISIHSYAKAVDIGELEYEQIIRNDGKTSYIKYEPTIEKSSATKLLGGLISNITSNNKEITLGSSYEPSFMSKIKVKNQRINRNWYKWVLGKFFCFVFWSI